MREDALKHPLFVFQKTMVEMETDLRVRKA